MIRGRGTLRGTQLAGFYLEHSAARQRSSAATLMNQDN
jgi:hypothetical protein